MTANPNEDLEIQEVSAKNSKLEAIEFMREMAGFPQMDYSKIAERMRIPQSTARDYLKRYIWGVLHTMHDSDYPRRLLEIYNHDTMAVPPAKALTRQDINHLNPVVNRYAKYTVEHPEVQKKSTSVDDSRPRPKPRTVSRNLREQEDDEAEEDEDEGEEDEEERFTPQKLMSPVAGSTNAQYINAILRDIPGIPSYKIERYLQFFTKNEADYMANPERFKKELKVWFGDGPGEMIFNSFHYGMSTFGKTGQGIGYNPYTGQPYGGSTPGSGTNDWIRNNPNLETYYKMGIIPYGVPPDSGIAIEAVNNFHEKQRRKEQREEEDESFNRWLKARTAKAMEDNIVGGGQGHSGMEMMNMTQLLAAGVVEMQVGIDESGKQVMKYIPKRNNSGGGGLFGGGNGNGNDPNMSLLSTIISGKDALINTLISKSMETPKVMESLLGKFIQNMDPDPTVQLTRLKQVSESLFPNNNIQNNIEAVRLKLEQTRLEKDMTMADNEARRMFEKDRWEKERAERMEIEAGKNTQNIMNGILGLGKEMLGPAMALLSGKGLAGLMPTAGGGMGMPGMGMPQGPPNPFAGFQQQQQNPFAQQQRPQPQQQRTLSPEAYAYMKQVEEAKRAGPSPGFAAQRPGQSFRPFQEAPPRRPVMQSQGDVIEEYEEGSVQHVHQHQHLQPQPQGPRVYSPSEFENASPETLQNAEREILRRKAELDNYLNSLRVAKRKRSNVFRTKRPTPEVEQEQYQIAPIVGGGSQIDTTVPPSTHQDIAVTNPRSETGSVDIPDMIPEKVQREEVNVPGQVVEETEEEGEDDTEEYEEGEDDDEDGEEEIEEAVEEDHK